MPQVVEVSKLTRAFRARDGEALTALFKRAPEFTLLHLDGCMRGLRDGPIPCDFVQWLRDEDKRLRRGLGWRQRLADLHLLRSAYSQGGLYLTVGAGVSMAARMPGWKDLVVEVLEYALEIGSPDDRQYIEKEVRSRIHASEEMIGWELKRILADRQPPSPGLRKRLERMLKRLKAMKSYDADALLKASQVAAERFGAKYTQRLRDILYARTLARTKIHPAIVRMIQPRMNDPSPRLHSIITYNFDDLIEWAIREKGLGFTVHCSLRGEHVTHRGMTEDRPSAVDIYHVHGVAPKSWIAELDGLDLVFTAEQYSVQYGEEQNFAREVQASFARKVVGLILGSSLSDDYAIRELEDAHRDNPGWFNYVVLRLPKEFRKKNVRPTKAALEKLGAPYQWMGLRVLWVREFDETPRILDFIRGEDVEV